MRNREEWVRQLDQIIADAVSERDHRRHRRDCVISAIFGLAIGLAVHFIVTIT